MDIKEIESTDEYKMLVDDNRELKRHILILEEKVIRYTDAAIQLTKYSSGMISEVERLKNKIADYCDEFNIVED